MTNQEAIETHKLMQAQVEWEYPMEYSAAIDEAFEAPEKRIRETTARDAVRRLIGKMNDDEYIAIMIKQEGKE